MADDKGGSTTVIPAEVKEQIGKLTPDQFKTEWPGVYEAIGKAAVPKPPEKYEGLAVPKESNLPASLLERTTAVARELGLSDVKQAQRIVDFTAQESKALLTSVMDSFKPGGSAFQAQQDEWKKVALDAQDIGGGKPEVLQAKVAMVTNFVKKYFPESVQKMINEYGIGGNPDFLRGMIKLGTLAKEDGFISGSPAGGEKKSAAERIYGGQAA